MLKLNLPNRITLTRICLIPIVVIMFYLTMIPYHRCIAAFLFLVTALTDFIDGHIARKRNLVTNLGKFLDPIADKVLVMVLLLVIVEAGDMIPAPYGAIGASCIVARELIIGGFRQIAAANQIVIAADKAGKIKTVMQDISIVAFLLKRDLNTLWDAIGIGGPWFDSLCYVIFGAAVLLTVYSGAHYLYVNRRVLFPKKGTDTAEDGSSDGEEADGGSEGEE